MSGRNPIQGAQTQRQRRRAVFFGGLAAAIIGTGAASVVIGERIAGRGPNEDVGSAKLRTTPNLTPGEGLLFNGWGVTPAGKHTPLEGDMPLKMALSPDGKTLAAVTCGYNGVGLSLLDTATQKVARFIPLPRAWNGLAWSRDGKRLYVSGGNSAVIHVIDVPGDAASATLVRSVTPMSDEKRSDLATFISGIALHPRSGKLYVCNEGGHEVWVVDPETWKREQTIPVGNHPHSVAVGNDPRFVYVSNWGARTVSVVDTQTHRRIRDINVGIRPNDMALAPDGRLFVACAGDNTVQVIQTKTLEAADLEANPDRRPPENTREIISTSLYPASPEGSTPSGVAVAPDGKTLYAVNSDNNSILVADITDPQTTAVAGFLPTGWYPTSVAVSADNATVFVGNGKGLTRSLPSYPPSKPGARQPRSDKPYNHPGRLFDGSVSFVTRPNPVDLAAFTTQVQRNSQYRPETLHRAPLDGKDSVIPAKVGDPSPIKYVLYIIKENRTYDQIMGDFRDAKGNRVGNGDPKLVMYGENVTPNHHALAREYVLLDNLYCNGEVSRDGHSWSHGAIATDYRQRAWTMSYSNHGDIPGNEDMNEPSSGWLWDHCRRHGISFKNYGAGARDVPTTNRGTWPGGRDMNKVDGWIADLKKAEQTGELPRFMIMSLGEDHTRGTTPGAPTPEACVASNDIGLGKIVAAASRSRFWKEMAIFVIEDDAQNGPDHVDSHRTFGVVISPYVKRGSIDSTLYTTTSMIRTMELILGLPPMTQYDAGATPMFATFGKKATVTAYEPKTPKVDVNARNPRNAPGAAQSAKMDWSEYDRIPDDVLNRILWRAAKGPNVSYPAPRHGAIIEGSPERNP